MKVAFVDTLYFVALFNPRDQWHERAIAASKLVAETKLITTEDVLVELLNFFSEYGERLAVEPSPKQREALRLLDSLAMDSTSERKDVDRKSIWQVVDEINAGLPADTWENVPTDGSINLGHHLYGAPRRQP